jgi:hypothetical protein
LDKERYLIKLGSKARQDLKEPFMNLAKEFDRVKTTHIDSNGNIGEMEFDEGDVFGKRFIRFYLLKILVRFTANLKLGNILMKSFLV